MAFFLSFGRDNALGQQNSNTIIPSMNHSKISEATQNNFIRNFKKTPAWVRTKRMAIITDGADACRKLCNRKFLHWSLE
jgi:hypothetical protein